jgi:alpha-beta hydrolase superfamily lysophospholipase
LLFFVLLFTALTQAATPTEIAASVSAHEKAVTGLKARNEARVILASDKPTPLSVLYLHGFSASPMESSPLTEDLAKKWKANAYLPRFRGHGIEGPEGLRGVKLADWEKETREALAVARDLGEKVVVIASSNGAALAIPALVEDSSRVSALILLSPSFRLHRWDSELLRLPFAKLITHLFFGEYREWQAKSEDHKYFWTTRYPAEILLEPVAAAAKARGAELEKLKIPVLLAYCPGDNVVSVPHILAAYKRLGGKKELVAVEKENDNHVIAGNILSPKNTTLLEQKISAFLKQLP